MLAPVRKELRGIARCTSAHIVDGFARNARVSKLQSNQRSEIAVGFRGTALNDRTTVRRLLHFRRNLFADLESFDANVRAERNDELCASIPGPNYAECGGSGGGGAPMGGEEGFVHVHAGMHGIGDFAAAARDWRSPVALVTVRRLR